VGVWAIRAPSYGRSGVSLRSEPNTDYVRSCCTECRKRDQQIYNVPDSDPALHAKWCSVGNTAASALDSRSVCAHPYYPYTLIDRVCNRDFVEDGDGIDDLKAEDYGDIATTPTAWGLLGLRSVCPQLLKLCHDDLNPYRAGCAPATHSGPEKDSKGGYFVGFGTS
jgi:hypothetical protein